MKHGSVICLATLLVAGAHPALAGTPVSAGQVPASQQVNLPAHTYVIQGSPAGRLLTGVITVPYMEAMNRPGADFHATFRSLLSERLAVLPYEDVQGTLRAMKDNLTVVSKAQIVGSIEAGLDPAVQDGKLGREVAEGIVSTAMNLEVILPVKEDVVASLEAVFEANKTAATGSAAKASQMVLRTFKTPIKGAYFGQAFPGETPVLFAPEILNEMSVWVETIAFSPDGTECFLGLGNADYSRAKLYHSTRLKDVWTPFVQPPFLSEFVLSTEAVFSPDGRTLTFTGQKVDGSKNLWTSRRTDRGWSAPDALPPEVNNGELVARGSTTSDGTLYFGRSPAGLHNQIYKAHQDASQKLVVEMLGAPVNVQSYDGDPCIAPDGRFLVFYSARVGGQGGTDLYVSVSDDHGGWKTPINLGPAFNSPYDEYGAQLSSDGSYLFFTRHTPQGNRLYWVAVSAVEKRGRSQEKLAGYIDQAPPGRTSQVFRLQTHEGYFAGDRIAISAGGKELYYTEVTSNWSDYNIRYYKYSDQKWNGPFDLFRGFLGPALSVDGKTMYFEKYNDSRTCWHSKRTDTGWGTPALCTEVPDPKDKHYLQDTASGRIYASSRGGLDGLGQMDISTFAKADATRAYRSLGRPLNSPGNEGDFYVARDEAFIVFGSPHRGGFGGGDLFISFRERDGSWSDPRNLGATINTSGFEFGPYVTDDKRYLFYSSSSDFTRVDVHWIRFDSLLETLTASGGRPAVTGPPVSAGQAPTTQPTELPARTYVIQGKPSEVVQNHEAVLALARQVETNLEADLETVDAGDKPTLTRTYTSLMAIAMVKSDHAAARRYLELVRELQDNPAVKLLTGVITIPYMQATASPGPDVRATFRGLLSTRLASLPFEDVRAMLGAMKSSQESASKAQVIDAVVAGVDPAVTDGQLSQQVAEALVGAAMNLEVILPLKEDVVACIEHYFNAVKAPQTTASAAGSASPRAVGTFTTRVKGAYFGQTLPGDTPVPFAPEILTSISPWVAGTAFSPDGTQLFVAVGAPDYSGARLYYSARVNDEWTPVVAAPFASDFVYSNEPVFSADGKSLTFTGRKSSGTKDLWTVGYANRKWGPPVALPTPINSDAEEFRGSYLTDGTLYFTSARSGMYQVYKAHRDATRTLVVELVGAPVSTNSYEGDPCIAPDGRFLVFNSARDGKSADLYVSFRDVRGGWGTPVRLGPEFNSPYDEYGAHLSSDGNYLFFTRHTSQGNQIYWVAVSAVEKLRPR